MNCELCKNEIVPGQRREPRDHAAVHETCPRSRYIVQLNSSCVSKDRLVKEIDLYWSYAPKVLATIPHSQALVEAVGGFEETFREESPEDFSVRVVEVGVDEPMFCCSECGSTHVTRRFQKSPMYRCGSCEAETDSVGIRKRGETDGTVICVSKVACCG